MTSKACDCRHRLSVLSRSRGLRGNHHLSMAGIEEALFGHATEERNHAC
jgi:hypothetical protein